MALKEDLKNKVNTLKKPVSRIQELLNGLIIKELTSVNLDKSFSAWCSFNGYKNTSQLFLNYSNDEVTHCDRHLEYMDKRVIRAYIGDIPKVEPCEFKDLKELIDYALQHMLMISTSYREACRIALEEQDYMLFGHLQWYINDQINGENEMNKLLDYYKLLNGDIALRAKFEDYIKEEFLEEEN